MSSAQPSSSKRAQRSDHKSGSQNNFHGLKCDSCNNSILSDHVQNTPCNHNICMLCVIKTNVMRGGSSNQSACCCQVESCNQYITSCQYFRAGSPGEVIRNEGGDDNHDIMVPSFDDLDTDVVANIFGCLGPVDIMRARLNKKMRNAAKKTIVHPTEFRIDSMRKYIAMAAMTTALPNLQQITIRTLGIGRKFRDGEDPTTWVAQRTANDTPQSVDIISRFSKLRILEIEDAPLNGRYPVLFNFPLLQNLTISNCINLKWDLEMLGGLPSLTELDCYNNNRLTGSLSSLRVLKNTLTKVQLNDCSNIRGNLMDLADFPHLKELDLPYTAVTGDIRDVGERDFSALESLSLPKDRKLQCEYNSDLTGNMNNLRVLKDTLTKVEINNCGHVEGNFMDLADFPHLKELELSCTNVTGDIREVSERDFLALKSLSLPSGVYGGEGHELQLISDYVINTVYSFKKQRPTLLKDWYGKLSEASPEWYYEEDDDGCNTAPLYIVFVQAGSRLGYRWETEDSDFPNACEVNWLDPEPCRESSDYEKYTKELQEIERKVDIYRGFHQPPTEEEHDRLWAEREGRGRE